MHPSPAGPLIPDRDRAEISERITDGWEAGHSVDHAFAQAWDEGVMLGSRRSWQHHDPRPRIHLRE